MVKRLSLLLAVLLGSASLAHAQADVCRVRQGTTCIVTATAVVPATNGSADLGTATVQWDDLFARNITVSLAAAFTVAPTISVNNITTTSTDGLTIQNTTASTSGTTAQYSPRLKWCGTAYNSSTPVSETDCWMIQGEPATAAGTTSVPLVFYNSIAGGAYTERARITSAGSYSSTSGSVTVNRYATTTASTTQGNCGPCAERIVKQTISIANATATTIGTVTVPNSAVAAAIRITVLASLGAGGAIGAFECSAILDGSIVVARTAGVNAVFSAATAGLTANQCVAGATTITLAYDLSTVSGAVGAVNTFTIRATITRGGGSSANHTALVLFDVVNYQAAGITIS